MQMQRKSNTENVKRTVILKAIIQFILRLLGIDKKHPDKKTEDVKMSSQRRWQIKKLQSGKCTCCGKEKESKKWLCNRCAERRSRKMKIAYQKRKCTRDK